MSPDKQRIAIAEACGWKDENRQWEGHHLWTDPKGIEGYCGNTWPDTASKASCLPDYLHDLNAMHAAVAAQEPLFREMFNDRLYLLGKSRDLLMCDMTAKDWADVFCGLLNADSLNSTP